MELIKIENLNGVDVVDSRVFAEELGIQHKNLLDTISKYEQELEETFGTVAFETRPLPGGGLPIRIAHLTEGQSMFIANLSRNTQRVVSFKARLVKSFLAARDIIKNNLVPKSQGELILMLAQQNVQTEQRLSLIESKVAEVAARQIGSPTDYFSIAGFASLRSQPIDTNKASALSKRCWTLCKELGYDRHTVPDPRFGKVYIYPKTVLETVFNVHFPIHKNAA